jgi:hypothetical protein
LKKTFALSATRIKRQRITMGMTTAMKTDLMEISIGSNWFDYYNVEDFYFILDDYYKEVVEDY